MKSRPTQFDVRENTASSRQHASRLSTDTASNAVCIDDQAPQTQRRFFQSDGSTAGVQDELHAASQHAATVEDERHDNHLLTVHDVAELLRVPASWVYGRMRKRSTQRLPAYRLGKYWRFSESEILAWVKRQHGGQHAA
jgi:excisionase family DNA binding protein